MNHDRCLRPFAPGSCRVFASGAGEEDPASVFEISQSPMDGLTVSVVWKRFSSSGSMAATMRGMTTSMSRVTVPRMTRGFLMRA